MNVVPREVKGPIPRRNTLPCSSLPCIASEKSLICSNPNTRDDLYWPPINPHNFNPNTSSTNQTENSENGSVSLCVWVSERLARSTAKGKGRGGSDGTCSVGTVNLINCEGGLLDVGCSLDTRK